MVDALVAANVAVRTAVVAKGAVERREGPQRAVSCPVATRRPGFFELRDADTGGVWSPLRMAGVKGTVVAFVVDSQGVQRAAGGQWSEGGREARPPHRKSVRGWR